jgi:ATP-dependent Clp protease adaptor protein ClpS
METYSQIMQQLCQHNAGLRQTWLSSDHDHDNKKPSDVTVLETKPKIKRPSLYKVIMLNDDFTPMEFVIHVLQLYFRKSQDEATEIMLHVHQRGVGVCGLYTYEIAETKASQVMDLARKNQHPLQLQLEKE